MSYRIAGPEFARLSSLYRSGVLDSASDPAFDRILDNLAADLHAPVAQLVFADAQRFWAKSSLGAVEPEHIRGPGLLHEMLTGGPACVTVECADGATGTQAFPASGAALCSFAGQRVVSPDDDALGVIYVADTRPRVFDPTSAARLAAAAAEIQVLLERGRRAREDEHTGALRRAAFLDQANRLMAVTRMGRQWISLVILDLAPFRAALEAKSAGLGRLALHHMADLGKTQLRRRDCFGRLGEDDFAVLLTDTGEAGARVLTQRLSRHLERGWVDAGLGLSGLRLGMASLKPAGADDIETLLAKARGAATPSSAMPPAVKVA